MFAIHLLSLNFVFQTKALVNAVHLLFTSSQPVNLSHSFFKEYNGTHSGEAVKTKLGTIELLAPLITSKTRLKLLTRFFLNQSVDGYLQGLSKELDENTNSIRLELNRLEKAGLLASKTEGRRKLYSVNTSHPLTSDLTSIVRKVSGIDALVERVTANLPSLEQVWVCGDLAKGLPSAYIQAVLVGVDLDRSYIKRLTDKAQSLTGKTITVKVEEETELSGVKDGLLVWQKLGEQ
jgi:predicted transcriptional regulator